MKKIFLEDALILNASRLFGAVLRLLPSGAALWLGRRLGDVVYTFSVRRRIALRNLRGAFAAEKSPEELERIARDSFRNMAVSGVELLRFPMLDDAWLNKNIGVTGAEKFEPFLGKGHGVIFLTGHFGNWELLNLAGSLLKHPIAALARRQKHPRSDEFLNALRASRGTEIIFKGMTLRQLILALRASKIIGMLSDQDGGRAGAKVLFFGKRSSTPRGAATFALRTGTPIFPVFIFRERGSQHRIEVEGPLPMPQNFSNLEEAERNLLQGFAEILEAKIRKDPGQWLWAHRRWKSAPERRALVLDDGKSGHLNQSLALTEAMKEARQNGTPEEDLGVFFHTSVVRIQIQNFFGLELLKWAAFIFGKRAPFRRRLLRLALTEACYLELMAIAADVVVSCGSQNAALNLLIAAENFATSAVVLKPPLPARHFDAVLAPRHDKMRPSAKFFATETSLLNITSQERFRHAGELERLVPSLGGYAKRIGFLVGGDAGKAALSRDIFEEVLGAVLRYGLEENAALLVTSSRRTPAWADELMKKKLGDTSLCPLLVIANEANRPGIVAGILGLADKVVVSGESMSMVSEAVASGKPVTVFIPSEIPLKSKHKAFLRNLHRRHLVALSDSKHLYETLKNNAASNGSLKTLLEHDQEVLRAAARRLLIG